MGKNAAMIKMIKIVPPPPFSIKETNVDPHG
jgi:hypothetical protein